MPIAIASRGSSKTRRSAPASAASVRASLVTDAAITAITDAARPAATTAATLHTSAWIQDESSSGVE